MTPPSSSIASFDDAVRDFEVKKVAGLLGGLPMPAPTTISQRIGKVSRRLLGTPYRQEPLGGGPDLPETVSVSVSAFDCVTYVEHVVALAMSGTPAEFPRFVRRLRYRQGRVTWEDRNHYMTDWIGNNAREGLVRRLGERSGLWIVRSRRLDLVPGVAPRDVNVRGIPKASFLARGPRLDTGDVLFFLSTRRHLDVFHCGIAVVDRSNDVPVCLMRHAARSRGEVVEQSLNSFVSANRMAGIIAVRPLAA